MHSVKINSKSLGQNWVSPGYFGALPEVLAVYTQAERQLLRKSVLLSLPLTQSETSSPVLVYCWRVCTHYALKSLVINGWPYLGRWSSQMCSYCTLWLFLLLKLTMVMTNWNWMTTRVQIKPNRHENHFPRRSAHFSSCWQCWRVLATFAAE